MNYQKFSIETLDSFFKDNPTAYSEVTSALMGKGQIAAIQTMKRFVDVSIPDANAWLLTKETTVLKLKRIGWYEPVKSAYEISRYLDDIVLNKENISQITNLVSYYWKASKVRIFLNAWFEA